MMGGPRDVHQDAFNKSVIVTTPMIEGAEFILTHSNWSEALTPSEMVAAIYRTMTSIQARSVSMDNRIHTEVRANLDLIAAQHLGICNLAQKTGDHGDFRELSVKQIKTALEAAYAAGQEAREPAADRAPDCPTSRAAAVAGIIANAVMAGEMTFSKGPELATIKRLPFIGDAAGGDDYDEGVRVAVLMIEARARASARTPSHAALSGAEAALALAEDALADRAEGDELPDAHAVLASIRDALHAGLDPLHAADGQAPYDASPPSA